MKVIRETLDLVPASIITAGVLIALVPFAVRLPATAVAAILFVSVLARSIAPVHQHGHAHRRIFEIAWLNGLYDLILMLAAGNTTAVWELQHVLGHHQMHLDPRADVAGVLRFSEEGRWRRVVFTVAGDFLSISDSIAIARRQSARKRTVLLRRLSLQLAAQVATIAFLLSLDPGLAIALFVVPNVLLRWMIFWFSFAQHDGAPAKDVYSGSVTRFGWTNAVFLNVGHHTAHHERPTLHWSRLPARTAEILHRIPASCLRPSRSPEHEPLDIRASAVVA